jgi:hypothetical protein
MTVSKIRMNFSASMGGASLVVASLVPSRLVDFEFNHLSESRPLSPAALREFGAGANAKPTEPA